MFNFFRFQGSNKEEKLKKKTNVFVIVVSVEFTVQSRPEQIQYLLLVTKLHFFDNHQLYMANQY